MELARFKQHGKFSVAAKFNDAWYSIQAFLPASADSVLDALIKWDQIQDQIQSQLDGEQLLRIDSNAQRVLPFQPLSLRDLMLSETHAVNAARGFVKRYMSKVLPLVNLFERSGRTFPMLKPKPIWHRQPLYYFSSHTNLVTDGEEVVWPAYSSDLDYELELAFVLSKPLYNATPQQALDAIGGFMVLNDFSARDVQLEEMRSGFGPQKSKHFANALSSTVVTADEILPVVNQLSGQVKINGKTVVETSTADMKHSLADVLVFLSQSEKLHPGEVIGLGTMPGGCAMENDHWLKEGDEITLTIDKVGSLTSRVTKGS